MFKIKTDRTYQYPVAVTYREGNDEKQGEFIGIFKTLNMAELERVGADDEKALDVVFVGAEGVEMEGHDGQSLSGDDMLAALRSDPDISQAIWAAYQDSYAKKGPEQNLKDAGRAWVMGASAGHESLEDDLSAFGLQSNTYDHLQPPEEFQLYEENCLAFEVFCSCSTQWRFAGMSGVQTGLDYSAVESVMRMMNIEKTAETFQKVRLIEIGALNALSEKRG